jgi:hypothetical protein
MKMTTIEINVSQTCELNEVEIAKQNTMGIFCSYNLRRERRITTS